MRQWMKHTLLIVIAGIWSLDVQAMDLNIGGTVVASACQVDNTSVSQVVDFGQLRSTDLKEAGSATEWAPFTVKLINCPSTTHSAKVTLTGTPYSDGPDLYGNSETAKNIAAQIALDNDKTVVIANGSSVTVMVDAKHSVVYNFVARLYSVNGNTSSGTFSSIVQMGFTYN